MAHADLAEADFQRYYQLDLRDLWRPGGGSSRLTLRRAAVLADGLPAESLLQSELALRHPISEVTAAILDLYKVATGELHPRWTARQDALARAEREALIAVEREKARAHRARRQLN